MEDFSTITPQEAAGRAACWQGVDRSLDPRERRLLRAARPVGARHVPFEDRYGVTGQRLVKPLGVPGHRPRGGVDLGAVVEASVVTGYLRGVYQPQGDYPAEVIDRALGYVEASSPPSIAEAKARMPAVLAYLDRRRRLGEPLEVGGSLFAPDDIDFHVATALGHLSRSARGAHLRALRHVAHGVLGPAEFHLRPLPLGDRGVRPGYSAVEMTELVGRAATHPSAVYGPAMRTLIAGSAGAGLATADWRIVRGTDVTVDNDGVVINIGGHNPRQVPVLARWEPWIVEAAAAAGDRHLLRPGTNHDNRSPLGALLSTKVSGDNPKLSAQRLRATWIIWHLASRTPIRALCVAAGYSPNDHGAAVARYLRFVPDMDAAEARGYLRDALPAGGTVP